MPILLFKTDIPTKKRVKDLSKLFKNHKEIKEWSVDTGDIDKVLRIEASGTLQEKDIINLVKTQGFHCEILTN